jgi:beta-phosphoglucomutase
MLQAIVFDFDGVLVDSEPLHWRAFLRIVEPMGVQFGYGKYLDEYVGHDDRDFFRAVARDFKLKISDADYPRLIREKAEAFQAIVGEGIAALPGAVELVRSSAKAMPIAIASGALRRDIDLILASLSKDGSLAASFRAIVTADEVAKSKPDPESYRVAVQRLGLDPAPCLAIEDTPAGLRSAKGAGLQTLGVAQSLGAEKLAIADRVVPTLAGVTVDQLQEWFG